VETKSTSSVNGVQSEIIKTEKETKEVTVKITEKVVEAENKEEEK